MNSHLDEESQSIEGWNITTATGCCLSLALENNKLLMYCNSCAGIDIAPLADRLPLRIETTPTTCTEIL